MSNFEVKSRINNYTICFIENLTRSFQEEILSGDVIVIDKKITQLYSDAISGISSTNKMIIIDATEEQKSYLGLEPVISELIEGGFKRNHRLVAIGGGIVQDVTAFIASILYRGIKWLFYPTTLLAQGDSCIGSKTSINFGGYKNQVGGFYPPLKIMIDTAFLSTLSEREIQSGLGEMCHYFIVSGKDDFDEFKRQYPLALESRNVLKTLINKSLEIKKRYIEIDEYDTKERRVFNYGHSFGHAIESLTDYTIPHGIAVSIGMDMANFVSVKLGFITDEVRKNIKELLERIWEGFSIADISTAVFMNALSKDKKNEGSILKLILNKGFGNIQQTEIKKDPVLSEWLDEYFRNFQ